MLAELQKYLASFVEADRINRLFLRLTQLRNKSYFLFLKLTYRDGDQHFIALDCLAVFKHHSDFLIKLFNGQNRFIQKKIILDIWKKTAFENFQLAQFV